MDKSDRVRRSVILSEIIDDDGRFLRYMARSDAGYFKVAGTEEVDSVIRNSVAGKEVTTRSEDVFEGKVIEVDGPPVSMFEDPNGDRHRYVTLARAVADPDWADAAVLHWLAEKSIQAIRDELMRVDSDLRVIYWRRRPQFKRDPDGKYTWRCRIGTYPALPAQFWDSLPVPRKEEGAEVMMLDPPALDEALADAQLTL